MTAQIELYGASTTPAEHAALASRQGVIDMLRAKPDPNDRTRRGIALVAHAADLDYARAWLARAVEIASTVEARRSTDPSFVITDGECAELYRAVGNFFRSINVCPYGWKWFRWRMEDLLGGPRNRSERASAGLDVSRITQSENEASVGTPTTPGGIGWVRRTEDGKVWYTNRRLGWWLPDRTPEDAPGVWRRAAIGILLGLDARGIAALEQPNQAGPGVYGPSHIGTNIFFGRPQDIGRPPPGVGDVPRGMPTNLSSIQRLPTGENHRVWLFNDGRVFRQPGAAQATPYNQMRVVDVVDHVMQRVQGSPRYERIVGELLNVDTVSRPDRWKEEELASLRQVPVNELALLPTGGEQAVDFIARLPVSPVIPPVEWYWLIFTAPMEGLRVEGGDRDLSLLEYIRSVGPTAMIREILRDTVSRNLLLMDARGITDEAQLFGTANRDRVTSASNAAGTVVDENARVQQTVQAGLGVATATATAINPIAGVIVGAGSLVTLAVLAATQSNESLAWVWVDVFGRACPAWEQFAIIDALPNLERVLREPEMQPPGGVQTREAREAAARDLAQQMAEFGAAQHTLDSDALRESTLTPGRATGVRTVALYGLDPTGGARVYANDSTDRELTTTPQETGLPARWQSSNDYGPVWVFGAPVGVTRIRVVYPDGGWRTIALPAAEEDNMNPQRTPQERTAFVDATPPTSEAPQSVTTQPVGENRSAQFPPRTVVLVGMQPGTRVFAQGDDVTNIPMLTGDAARWIESTIPGVQGWSFGVPLDNTRALDLLLPDGTRRSIALAPLPANASLADRVTVIDLTGSSAAGQYPSRTVVLVGMPEGSRVLKGGEDITNIPMLTGDAARWIESTLPGVQGWSFGVPDGTRVMEVVTPSGQRIPVTLPPMDPALAIEAKVTVIDLRAFLTDDASQASAGGGGGALLLVGLAAAVAAGHYYLKDR